MEDLIDGGGVEVFFEGVHEVRIIEGVIRIVLFSRQNGGRHVAGRLVAPLNVLPDMIQLLAKALAEARR